MAPVTWTATVEKRLVPLTEALNSVELINTIQRISTPTFAAVIFQMISLGDGVSPQNIFPDGSYQHRFMVGVNVGNCIQTKDASTTPRNF